MTKMADNGVPMHTLEEKLVALAHCLARNYFEDAAGHLCDLLEHCRTHIEPSVGKPFKDLKAMVKHYGNNLTPIDEDPV